MMMDLVKVKEESAEDKCDFCHLSNINDKNYGPMYKKEGITAHYFCILFSSTLRQVGKDDEGILGFLTKDIRTELQKGETMICDFCSKDCATITCWKSVPPCKSKRKEGEEIQLCQARFHFTCGVENGTHHKFQGNYASFCPEHKPIYVTHAPKYVRENPRAWVCDICTDEIQPDEPQIWPMCCKLGVFHKECIVNQALSSGRVWLKCPLCRCKDRFLRNVEMAGVFVPDRDAEWEQEPGAYADFTPKLTCEARNSCQCPHGIKFDAKNESIWSLKKCFACGGSAIHIGCKGQNAEWICAACRPLISQTKAQEIAEKMSIDTSPSVPVPPTEPLDNLVNCLIDDNLTDYSLLRNAHPSAYYTCDPKCPFVKHFINVSPNRSFSKTKWLHYGNLDDVTFQKIRTVQENDESTNRIVLRMKPGSAFTYLVPKEYNILIEPKNDDDDNDNDTVFKSSCDLQTYLVVHGSVLLCYTLDTTFNSDFNFVNVNRFGQICIRKGIPYMLENVSDEEVELYCITKKGATVGPNFSGISYILPNTLVWSAQLTGIFHCPARFQEAAANSDSVNKWMMTINAKTVTPMEECKSAMLVTVLHGTLKVKSTNFKITEQGEPCLISVSMDAGSHIEVPYGSTFSLENWTNDQLILLCELL